MCHCLLLLLLQSLRLRHGGDGVDASHVNASAGRIVEAVAEGTALFVHNVRSDRPPTRLRMSFRSKKLSCMSLTHRRWGDRMVSYASRSTTRDSSAWAQPRLRGRESAAHGWSPTIIWCSRILTVENVTDLRLGDVDLLHDVLLGLLLPSKERHASMTPMSSENLRKDKDTDLRRRRWYCSSFSSSRDSTRRGKLSHPRRSSFCGTADVGGKDIGAVTAEFAFCSRRKASSGMSTGMQDSIRFIWAKDPPCSVGTIGCG